MKHIFLVLIFCIACTQASVTKRESDREHDGFVGPVKKVFVVWSPISGSDYPVGSRCRSMTNIYDQSGRLMHHSVYPGACGEDERREDYSYARDGSRTEKTQEIRGKDSPPPPPPIASRSNQEEERGEPRTVFKYDSSGKLVEEATLWPSGKVLYKTGYSHDAQGRMTEMTGYNSGGRISVRRVYSYSGDERVPSGFAYYDGEGEVRERTAYTDYEFNSRGDWIKRRETTEEVIYHRTFRRVLMIFREIEYYPTGK